MLATHVSGPSVSPTRRALTALLTLALTVIGTFAGIVAAPAGAGLPPTSCTWTELTGLPEGLRAAELNATTDGWMVLFADGVRNDDESMWLRGTIKNADAEFASQFGADVIEWRWYDPSVYDSESLATITHESPYLCDFNWPVAAPATAQSIDFTQPADVTYDDTLEPLDVSATSGLPVTTESLTEDVCTVDGVDVDLVGLGECTIKATQAGGTAPDTTEYAAASPVTRTFNVNAGSLHQDVQFTDPDNMRLGEGSQVLLATAGSEGPIWFESLTPAVCIATNRASNSTVSADALGECTVRAHQDGGPVGDGHYEYNAATADKTFHVWPAALDQTITFPALDDVNLSDSAQYPSASSTSDLAITYRSLTPETCSVTGDHAWRPPSASPTPRASGVRTQVDYLTAGTCTIEAIQDGNADVSTLETVYNAAEPVTRSFLISVDPILSQTITFPAPAQMSVGDAPQSLQATASSGLPVTYDLPATAGVCSLDGAKVVAHHAGSCVIVAEQAGGVRDGHTYSAAEYVLRTVTIVAAPVPPVAKTQEVTASGAHGYALSARTAGVKFTSSAGLPVTVKSGTPKVCTVADGTVVLKSAGACSLIAVATGNAVYAESKQVTVTFPVWAAPKVPAKARAPRAVAMLGQGEEAYRVTASPAKICGTAAGKVVLTGAGTCTVVVQDGARVVRRSSIAVTEVKAAKPSTKDLELVGSVRFDFNSAELTPTSKKTLRHLAPKLRTSELVVVYGNTQAYGGGDNPANRKLSARRAAVVVKFLRGLSVKAKATTVAMSSRNPVGKDEAANRRADVYWVP
jgi:outer membrane protein OmpA-like peptidoglycan-associated protein